MVHDWQPQEEVTRLDLDGEDIRTVIWATGYRLDFSWIDLPVLGERGCPRCRRGVAEQPGLYFVGLHWLHTFGSGLFYGVGADAEHVATHIAERVGE